MAKEGGSHHEDDDDDDDKDVCVRDIRVLTSRVHGTEVAEGKGRGMETMGQKAVQ